MGIESVGTVADGCGLRMLVDGKGGVNSSVRMSVVMREHVFGLKATGVQRLAARGADARACRSADPKG